MGQGTEETVVVESDRLSRAGEEGQSVARRQLNTALVWTEQSFGRSSRLPAAAQLHR